MSEATRASSKASMRMSEGRQADDDDEDGDEEWTIEDADSAGKATKSKEIDRVKQRSRRAEFPL